MLEVWLCWRLRRRQHEHAGKQRRRTRLPESGWNDLRHPATGSFKHCPAGSAAVPHLRASVCCLKAPESD
eukprot:5436453-Alexandrium_andersonii.AAC.1